MKLSQMVERAKGEAIVENDVDDAAAKQAEEAAAEEAKSAAEMKAEIDNLKALAGI